ncbi:MAG: V-type ATP synthase subunit B [bacterium]|nr:V-type ATP synthase subunit B [bacterium]
MAVEYLGLSSINGPLVAIEGIRGAAYDEIVEMSVGGKEKKLGRIIEIYGDKAVIQVFGGTENMALRNTHTRLTGHPMEIGLSTDMLGRTFNGIGVPIDGLGRIRAEKYADVNGKPLNPVTREYPRNYIRTGISAIDGLTTLIRGQKLPIFSGNGLPHDQLAAQIVQQASLGDNSNEQFAIVFAAMGVKYDVAEFFRRTFEESGVSSHVATFINLANDPVVERLITPKLALTVAEYLAFEKGMHILVILTDMTSFAEAMREVSSSKGEIPSRKGFPGYLYSELASIYERAGIVRGVNGSVTQIPILSMPNDDITHPIPDLTGYITEGQIVLDRNLNGQSIYPPINILPSLSRLMKDGIGEGFTRKDHQALANQLFSCYAKVGDARALASVIGEDELSPLDKKYLAFGKEFENRFIGQGRHENRSILETLEIGWELLGMLPREELDRVDTKILDEFYKAADSKSSDSKEDDSNLNDSNLNDSKPDPSKPDSSSDSSGR